MSIWRLEVSMECLHTNSMQNMVDFLLRPLFICGCGGAEETQRTGAAGSSLFLHGRRRCRPGPAETPPDAGDLYSPARMGKLYTSWNTKGVW